MKRTMTLLLLAVVLTAVSCMSPIALAAEVCYPTAVMVLPFSSTVLGIYWVSWLPLAAEVCYPTAVEQSEDGGEIRKVYDLSPEQDPAGIPRSDFEQNLTCPVRQILLVQHADEVGTVPARLLTVFKTGRVHGPTGSGGGAAKSSRSPPELAAGCL